MKKLLSISDLQITSIACYGIRFNNKEIIELINFIDSYGYSKYHPEFTKEFFKLVDYIFVAMIGDPNIADSIFINLEKKL